MKEVEYLIKALAFAELREKNFGATEQFLEIHSIETHDDGFKIANIIINDNDAAVFFNVEEEDFYFVIYFDLKPEIEIASTRSEPKFEISVQFSSEDMSENQMKSFTKLMPNKSWNNGDKKKFGTSFHKFSSLVFKPNSEADFFEKKLEKTLDFLETDKEGVFNLSEKSIANLEIFTTYHNGNTLLDELFISKKNLKRITDLNLSLSFRGFASGNLYKG